MSTPISKNIFSLYIYIEYFYEVTLYIEYFYEVPIYTQNTFTPGQQNKCQFPISKNIFSLYIEYFYEAHTKMNLPANRINKYPIRRNTFCLYIYIEYFYEPLPIYT